MMHGSCEHCAEHVPALHENKHTSEDVRSLTSIVQQISTISSWILTWGVVLATPKCPACLATYVAFSTGIGLSISTASSIRMGLIAACFASLAFLTTRLIRQRITAWRECEHPT